MITLKSRQNGWLLVAILVLGWGLFAACTTSSATDSGNGAAGHDPESRVFVPNNGAEVRLVSPADGAVFSSSDTIIITIEPTNFTIGEEGNHWHIYLDGTPIMVIGGTSFVVQNLSPGEHQIEVYLSLGTHEDLEQGDQVSITVEE